MKQIIRLFVLIAALVLGADHAWANAESNPRVKFVYESNHGFALASDADANRQVTITVTPVGDYRCMAGDLSAIVSLGSGMAQAPRRTLEVGQPVPVTCTATNVFTLTLPEDNNLNATVYVSFRAKAPLTVTANDHTINYGEAPANNGVTYYGFEGADDASVLSGTLSFDYTYNQFDPVDTYSITPYGLTSDNYAITFVPGTLIVNPKSIRIDEGSVSVEDKMYNGTTNGTLYGSFTFEDGMIVESDDVSIDASGVSATFADKNVGEDKVVTVTGLALGGADIDNYILENSEFTLTGNITKQELTVSAMDHTIYYGDAPANNGVEYYGFENGEDESVLGGDLDYDYTYTKGDPVGDYYITPKGLTSNNYVIIFAKGMLTVEKKMLTFDGSNVSGIEKEYDGTEDVDNLDEIDIRPQGIYNNDDVKVVVVSGSYASKDVGNNIEVTIYEVELSGNKKDNYDIDNNPSVKTSGRIIQRNVKITGISVTPKVYDGENWADVNYNSAEFDRLVDGDDVKLYPLNVDATYESVNVGTGIKVSLSFGDATLTGSDEGNYTLDRDECVGETTGDIEKASLIVTAKDHSIDYGDKPANNGVDYDGFVDGEDENNNDLSGTLGFEYTYTQYGPVGTYQITPKGLSSDNYAITFNPGTLTVNQVATILVDWKDGNNPGDLRPASLEFRLLANGVETERTVTLNESNYWSTTVDGLTPNNSGNLIQYTWSLVNDISDNYESGDPAQSTTNTGATATFTLARKTGSLTVSNTLVSDLAADADVEFTYNVTLDDTTIDGEYGGMTFENGVATATLKGGESATATGLMYGTTYTVTQTEVEGFTTSPKVEELLIATGTISTSSTQATFTNTRQMFTITFKNWDGTELSSATYTYGTAAADIEQPDPLPTKAANAEYTYTFKGWTPEIVQVTGDATYTATYNEIVEKTQVSVDAIWDDNNNAEGFRPKNITVKLLADGEEVGTTTLNADNEWNYTFTGLNKYADGQEIEYTLRQDQLAYYKTPVIEKVSETEWEYTVTNSRTVEKTEATVKVVWVDGNNELHNRPSVTATLLADGTATVHTVTLKAENDWTATAEQLNKYKNGTEIVYTWSQGTLPEGYIHTNSSVAGAVTTLTYVSSVDNAYTITQDQNGVTLTLVVPDENTAPQTVSIPTPVEVDHVVIDRLFEKGKAATVYLPFSIEVSKIDGGTFHTFESVDETTTPLWTVYYSTALADDAILQANTPYIFMPDDQNSGKITVNNGNEKVSVCTANTYTAQDTGGNWEFIGTYEAIVWISGHSDLGKVYGFAAEEVKDGDKTVFDVGQFVRVGAGANIAPMRAYLKRTSTNAPSMDGRAAEDLPATMRVVLINSNGATSIDGEVTGISEMRNDAWYTLDGRKVNGQPLKKGMYIHNGRKEVIR